MLSVVFMMTDGLRPEAISNDNTPHLISFMKRGSHTLNGQSVVPSITLPCHTSIFHSVPPQRHGILDNNWHSMARPVIGLVEHLRAHNKKTGFIHNWDFLRDLTRPGNLYFNYFVDTGYDLDGDQIIAETAIQHIGNDSVDFLFVYFASVDVAGHKFGWLSEEYMTQAHLVDELIGKVLSVTSNQTTIIIHSDHGGHDRTHGTDMPEDMTIPWMAVGKNIKVNHQIQELVSILDTAPTIAHLLGVDPHVHWEGKIISEIFNPES